MRRNGHKYGAVKTVIDGHTFASKAEAKRYGELKLLEKAGEISFLQLQPEFDLHAITMMSQRKKIGRYVADFQYVDRAHKLVVEDVKSPATKTAVYRLKKKMVEAQYGIEITEITR